MLVSAFDYSTKVSLLSITERIFVSKMVNSLYRNCALGNIEGVRKALEAGTDPNIRCLDLYLCTPLVGAISHNISQYLTIYHNILQYLTIFHNMIQYLTNKYQVFRSPLTFDRCNISKYLAIYHNFSQYLTLSHNISGV